MARFWGFWAFLASAYFNSGSALQCYQCNSTESGPCPAKITNSSQSVPLISCSSFDVTPHCATISYLRGDGEFNVERDCLASNLDCAGLKKLLLLRYGILEEFKCERCAVSGCNREEVVANRANMTSQKIYIFVYMFFLFALIGIAALCEF